MRDRDGRPPATAGRSEQFNTANGDGTVYGVMGGNINIYSGGNGPGPSSAASEAPAAGTSDAIRVLLLSANPLAAQQLAIDEEARAIAERLRMSLDRDTIELVTCLAVRPGDLLQHLNQYRPRVVHFSGHGDPSGQIVLSTGRGGSQAVGAEALAELFRIMKDDILVVVLNACYSAIQAHAIGQHIDFIVGMRSVISDDAAVVFAAAFYSALGFRRTVRQAFDQATTALLLHGMSDHCVPELIVRPGADPDVALLP